MRAAREITYDGLAFEAQGGRGAGVLLVHGMTGAPAEMKHLAKRMLQRGFSVSAPLLAGHGGDARSLLRTRWTDWLDTVHQAHRRMRAHHDQVFVAGICVGGALGVALCAEAHDVAGAAVYSPTYRYDGWNMRGWWSAITPLARPFAGLPGIRRMSFEEPYPFGLKDERLRSGMASAQGAVIPGALDRIPLGAMSEMHHLMDHVDKVAHRVETPTLILHASEDDMSHPRNAYRLGGALGGAATVRLIEDSYHMIHVDRRRDHVAALTADFFDLAAQSAVRGRAS